MATKTAILLYKTTILSIFDYNDLYFFVLPEGKLKKLESLQNRALRIILIYGEYNVEELRRQANVTSLKERRILLMERATQ